LTASLSSLTYTILSLASLTLAIDALQISPCASSTSVFHSKS
jgi:hypothetical protein